jgi:hypothetical protein
MRSLAMLCSLNTRLLHILIYFLDNFPLSVLQQEKALKIRNAENINIYLYESIL